jgi:predicted ATPase
MIEMRNGRCEFAEAIGLARRALRAFGITLPERPRRLSILRELAILRYRQGRRSFAQLAELPACANERIRYVIQILMAMSPAAFFSARKLNSFCLLKMASLSLKHGATEHSAYGFVGYGIILSGTFGEYQKGFDLGEAGLRLDERFGDGSLEAKIYSLSGAFLTVWVRPYAEALARLRRAEEAGLRLGDMTFRGYATTWATSIIDLQAAKVEDVLDAVAKSIDVSRAIRDRDRTTSYEMYQQYWERLRSSRSDPTSLSEPGCSEDQLRASLGNIQSPIGKAAYFQFKAMLCYTFGLYTEAWRHVPEAEKREGALLSQPWLVVFPFYRVLIASQLLCDGSSEEKQLRRSIAQSLARLRKWARACPENFASRYLLAEAEAARAAGRYAKAAAGYQAAQAAASQSGAVGIEALAHELWARLLRSRAHTGEAREHLRLAIAAYERWGALAIAKHLQAAEG